MKKILLYSFIFIALLSVVNAQTAYTLGGNATGTVANACGGIFYDSGGSGGKYGNNETDSVTFCAPAGQYISFTFTTFNTEQFSDILYVFDGSTSASPLIGSYDGTATTPRITIYSSLGGCLTFLFTSDGVTTKAGWAANIACSSTMPAPAAAGACSVSSPFCSTSSPTGITFPAITDGTNTGSSGSTAEPGPAYGCLGSTPNPAWYYLQVANTGPMVLTVAGSLGNDVDFICWGPFTSPTSCGTSLTGTCGINSSSVTTNAACSGNIVDCSYSTSATETCTIAGAVSGQYYLLLITNYDDIPQNINLNQTGGTGSTNCNIVTCGITATNTGPYCVGETITLNAATTNTTATTYAWAGPGGFTASGQSVTIPGSTLAMSGTYSVTGTTGTVTCVATTTVAVTNAAAPAVTTTTICAGSTGTLTASGATTYTWSTGATTAAMTNNPLTTTVYTVTGSVGTCTAAATATITVVTTTTSTPSVSSATICAGSTGTLTATGAATSYTWSTGATTPTMTNNPVATTVYTVTGSVGTCTAAATGTITVVTTTTSTPSVSSATICAGSSGTLTATGAATSYTWSTGATTPTMTDNPTATTIYTVTGSVGTCTAAATGTITVVTFTTTATPTVTPITICAGSAGTLTATGAATSYTWSTGATTPTMTDNPASTTVYTVTGSVGTCTAAATATITVAANPTLTVNSGTICTVGSTTLIATSTSPGTTYSWLPITGLNNANTATVTATNLSSTTVYTINGTAGTCTATPITTTVTVITAITPTATTGAPPCANQTLNLFCNPGSYTNYLWSGPNTFTSIAQNPIKTGITTAATGIYTLVVTDVNNCVSTTTLNVVVNPLPAVVGNATPACINDVITFSATPGFVSYSWSGPNGITLSGQSPTIASASATDQGFYVVTVVDINGCTNANVTPILVTVHSPPSVSVNDTTICVLTTGTLTASGSANYAWSSPTTINDLSTNFGNPVLVTPSIAGTTIYIVTGTDVNGCVNTATAVVNANDLPTVSITPALSKGCTPQCDTFAVSGPSGSTYSWNFGNGQGSTNASPTACFTTAANYVVKLTLTDANHCKNTATANVITYAIPVANFYYTPDPVSILDPTVTFFNATQGLNIVQYFWDFEDSLSTNIDTSTNPKHTYLNVGSYPVTLIAVSANGCSDTIVKTIVIEQDFVLYVPNSFTPNGDGRNEIFKAEGEGITDFKMYIFDRWGNNVFTTSDINVGWDGRINDRGGVSLADDVYVWKIDLKNVAHQGKTYTGTVIMLK